MEAVCIQASSIAVSREHRRAKTDRINDLLKRAFLGWLRGERDHCKMWRSQQSNKRSNRERENLVGEQNRIINRMKATFIRLGVRELNPKLKKAADGSMPCARRRASRSRQIRWLNCVAI